MVDELVERCINCKYFTDAPGSLGICRRYPPTERKQSTTKDNDWCGEFKEK